MASTFQHLTEGVGELVRTTCVLETTSHTTQLLHHLFRRHSLHEFSDAFQVSVAATSKRHVVDGIVVVELDVYCLTAGALSVTIQR